jgi:protein-disulfide isomerase
MDLRLPVNEHDHMQGPVEAPATLLVYGDYECPYTRASLLVVKQVRKRLGDRMGFVFRNFPLVEIHPHALRAAEAAEAAAAQSSRLFWKMHAYLFAHQQALEDADLHEYAAQLGLELERFDGAMAEHAHAARIREDVSSGLASGVGGTPTFFINGMRHNGSWKIEALLPAYFGEIAQLNGAWRTLRGEMRWRDNCTSSVRHGPNCS